MIFAKMAADLDSHPKIRKAGRDGREVFLFILRRNALMDYGGRLPASIVEPWYLADQLMMDEVTASNGVSRAVTAGLLRVDTGQIAIVGWDEEWSKRPMTTAERQSLYRSRHGKLESKVTDSNGAIVTVNACNVLDEKRVDEKRREETHREQTPVAPDGGVTDLGFLSDPDLPIATDSPQLTVLKAKVDAVTGDIGRKRARKSRPSEPTESERASAVTVLAKLSAQNGIAYTGSKEHVRLIVARMRDGVSEMDLRAVIGFCALELNGGWKGNPRMEHFLRPETLFGSGTIQRYLDAARTWFAKLPDEPLNGTNHGR